MAKSKSSAPYILSLIAGILILLEGILTVAATSLLSSIMGTIEIAVPNIVSDTMLGMGIGGVVLGIVVLLGAHFMKKGKEPMGSILVLVLSIAAFFVGSGFFLGTILGIIGGALGLKNK